MNLLHVIIKILKLVISMKSIIKTSTEKPQNETPIIIHIRVHLRSENSYLLQDQLRETIDLAHQGIMCSHHKFE